MIVLLIQQLKTLELWYFNSNRSFGLKFRFFLYTKLFIFGEFFGACLELEWRFEWRALYLDSLGIKHVLTSLVHARIFHHFHDILSLPESAIHGTKSCRNCSQSSFEMARAKQPVHLYFGGRTAVIQQGANVWVGSSPTLKSPTQKYK